MNGDVHAFNLMVAPSGEHEALSDWGNSGCGDPARELSTIAIDLIEPLVAGYRDAAPSLVDDGFEARVLWNQIGHSLRKAASPRPGRSASAGIDRLDRLATWAARGSGRWCAWLPDR